MGLPKPFQRPSVDLGGPKREWTVVAAADLRVGDTLPDFGVIRDIQYTSYTDGVMGNLVQCVRLLSVSGIVKEWTYEAKLKAFVAID